LSASVEKTQTREKLCRQCGEKCFARAMILVSKKLRIKIMVKEKLKCRRRNEASSNDAAIEVKVGPPIKNDN
jgi:hypothetical protein